ncbi:hypothetical protein OUZ56_002340 [Daphnia magna]|uniref:Secreted protein n=1 Tax=Daphnia magna TaxID=35525 RepID=A0ABR0A5E8_9CRUS|nr:hypothetical protein OUZ56_002340 [Daphnia magna]
MKAAFLAPSCASRCASSSAAGIPQCEGAVAYHFAIRIRRDVFSRDTTGHNWCVVLDACANGCQQMTCAEKEQQQTKTR